MPDITMCEGKDCPLKETCYRFTAKADIYYQAFFAEPPFINNEKNNAVQKGYVGCKYYWKTK